MPARVLPPSRGPTLAGLSHRLVKLQGNRPIPRILTPDGRRPATYNEHANGTGREFPCSVQSRTPAAWDSALRLVPEHGFNALTKDGARSVGPDLPNGWPIDKDPPPWSNRRCRVPYPMPIERHPGRSCYSLAWSSSWVPSRRFKGLPSRAGTIIRLPSRSHWLRPPPIRLPQSVP